MFLTAITRDYPAEAELVAVCDRNAGRVALAQAQYTVAGAAPRGYAAADFDRMIAETRPDTVIVTTQDSAHDVYICRAMELGCDVVTEKPMTTDADKCRRILETRRRTGRRCTVTFNYRYAPVRSQVKELLMGGAIGDILSVDFAWLLDTRHGADYFRRWHRDKANSGGLLVHKATHHFDLVNWWLSDLPESVFARGSRRFYTPETARRYGLEPRGERCLDCVRAGDCPFALDLRGKDSLRKLYLECEQHDGYFRDRCVFNPEDGQAMRPGVDIEDSMNVLVRYRGGALLNYTLVAYAPWEGYTVNFNGTAGRLQYRTSEASYVNGDGTTPGEQVRELTSIKIFPLWRQAYSPELRAAKGGHGGADPVMLDYVFREGMPADPLKRAADERAGAYSILCGVAGNLSMREGREVRIADLVDPIEAPDYPAMPTAADPLWLPPPQPPA